MDLPISASFQRVYTLKGTINPSNCSIYTLNFQLVSRLFNNIFKEGELDKNSVWAKFACTASDGKTYNVDYYNLDVIISVGYHVKSHRGTQFRIWAMGILNALGSSQAHNMHYFLINQIIHFSNSHSTVSKINLQTIYPSSLCR